MPQSTSFNDSVQADVFWVCSGSTKFPVMSIVEMATRYTSATLLRSEQTAEHIKAFERCWIAHFGPPTKLITDEGRPSLGHP